MSGFVHETVLRDPVIANLAAQPRGTDSVYVDGTLGGGGHAEALLTACPDARLVGIDRDPSALAAAGDRLAAFGDRVTLVHASYSELPAVLAARGIPAIHGLVLDLGVSSPQLDLPERGFSFQRSGPLDMRMDPTRGPTALALIEDTDEEDLANLIFELGEERHSRRVARAIKDAAAAGALATTTDLAAVIARTIPLAEQRKSKIHAATRTFQALRIAVNAELAELEALLAALPALLAPGGRAAIISFHSLEDRLVKQRFRDLAWTSSLPPHLARAAGERVEPVCQLITRKAIVADDAEISRNPRARSARLRVCERTAAPDLPATTAPAR